MAVKKFLGWVIAGIILLVVSAIILMGNLMNSKVASSRKPAAMKELRCKDGEYYTTVERDGKIYKYCVKKIQKVQPPPETLRQTVLGQDIFARANGKRYARSLRLHTLATVSVLS